MAEVNDLATVRYLLNKGANVNAQDERGRSALMLAAGNKNLEMCRLLINKGADVNLVGQEGVTALSYAFHSQDVPVIEFLLSKGASWDTRWYTSNNLIFVLLEMPDAMYWLKRGLQHGADPNGRNDVYGSPLSRAFSLQRLDLAQALVDAGANVNEKGFKGDPTVSLAGAYFGYNTQWTIFLLNNGADPNGYTGLEGYLLEAALREPNWEVVDLVVKKGADVNLSSSTEGITPLMLAIRPPYQCKHVEHNVKLLVEAGADVQARDIDGKTALHYLFEQSPACLPAATYLLAHGAEINAVDERGYSVLDYEEYFFKRHVRPEDIEFLKKHGAKHTLRGRWWKIKQYFKF
jgi:ankyrin repeat protein